MPDRELAAPKVRLDDVSFDYADVVFDKQDSGCVSWGVTVDDQRWFVKQARSDRAAASLRNCLAFHSAVEHPAIVQPTHAFDAERLTVVYPWVPGEVLNAATISGSDRRALARFRLLSVEAIRKAISTVLDAHVTITNEGFVAVDFYDGCLLYDFENLQVRLIDLDEYRSGPFTLTQDRLPGSTSYMAPEETVYGSCIDQRTTVFNLGRMIHHLVAAPDGWRGSEAQASIVARSTHSTPGQRFASVAELNDAWLLSLDEAS